MCLNAYGGLSRGVVEVIRFGVLRVVVGYFIVIIIFFKKMFFIGFLWIVESSLCVLSYVD